MALANNAVRLTVVTQLGVSMNFVRRCFTGLCILTAMNGGFINGILTAKRVKHETKGSSGLFRFPMTPIVNLSYPPFMLPPAPMPAASDFERFPVDGEAPRIQ